MSDKMDENLNPNGVNPEGANDGKDEGANKDKPAKEKGRLAKLKDKVVETVKEDVKIVKEHPAFVAVTTALGIGVGGYATYKVMSRNAAPNPSSYAPPMIPAGYEETEEEKKDEATTDVEYVNIPE